MPEIGFERLAARPKALRDRKPDLRTWDKGYFYTRFDFYISKDNLYVYMFTLSRKRKNIWFVLQGFREYTARDVIAIEDNGLGRHFRDGILKLWKIQNLDIGWHVKTIRPKQGGINHSEQER